MSNKPAPIPKWWKNTYFWIAGFLLCVALYGLVRGQNTIRDPGQMEEPFLSLIYFGGAVVMLLNGWLSHRLTLQAYAESQEGGSE